MKKLFYCFVATVDKERIRRHGLNGKEKISPQRHEGHKEEIF